MSWTSQQCMEKLSDKTAHIELRLDHSAGLSWEVLRHLKQHFIEFDPQAGGSALYLEFLTSKRQSLASGPVAHYPQEAAWMLSNSFFVLWGFQANIHSVIRTEFDS